MELFFIIKLNREINLILFDIARSVLGFSIDIDFWAEKRDPEWGISFCPVAYPDLWNEWL